MQRFAHADSLAAQPIPGPPPFSLVAGIAQMIQFRRDPIGFMYNLQTTYGNFVTLTGGKKRVFFAFGPEYNHRLHADPERFQSGGFLLPGPEGSAQRRLSTSLFTQNGEQHKHHRRLLLPPFQKSALAAYHADLVNLLHEKLQAWRPGEVRDMLHEMHHWTWCIAGKLLYGLDTTTGAEGLRERIEDWMRLNVSAWVHLFRLDWPFTPYRRLLRQAERLEQEFLAMIRAKTSAACPRHDVLSILMRTRTIPGQELTDGELVGHALNLFLAAYETTANTLTWTLFLLAQHPHVQAEVLDELSFLDGEAPTLDQLNHLPLLDNVLKESMRLLPAIVFSCRVAAADGELGPYFLPRGSKVTFSHYLTHHLPDLYPEPERFRPERWLGIAPTSAEYLPFGAGARTCIGASFALFILKTALALILPRWRLTMVPHTRIDRQVVVSLSPKHGLPMILARQDRQFQCPPVRGNIHEMVDLTPERQRTVACRSLCRAA